MQRFITSADNGRIREIRSLLSKKGRNQANCYLAEGARMVREAFAFAPGDMAALVVDGERLPAYQNEAAQAAAAGLEIVAVTESVMRSLSDVRAPQGICAVMRRRAREIPAEARLLAALDGLQDPANVGAIIRTADAAGAGGALLSDDCADAWSPKALRAAMGSHFHIAVKTAGLVHALNELKADGFIVYGAHLKGDESMDFDGHEKACVVIGSEAHGLRPEVERRCDRLVRIPIYGRAESLNAAVAAGILLYAVARAGQ